MNIVEIAYCYDGREGADAARPRPVDAEEARVRLSEGSRAIATLVAEAHEKGGARREVHLDPGDLGIGGEEGVRPPQRPFAAVLGCADARVPVELLFNEGPNDLFVVRVAGNGLGAEGLGSLRYAADHFGETMKLVVVLGHSGCGAVTAAVDAFLDPKSYLDLAHMHALRAIVDRILVVVHAAARRIADVHGAAAAGRPGYRSALLESAIAANAALAAHTLDRELGANGLRAAYGVWLLESRAVWAPRHHDDGCDGLAYPPADSAQFERFADALVKSKRIVSLLA